MWGQGHLERKSQVHQITDSSAWRWRWGSFSAPPPFHLTLFQKAAGRRAIASHPGGSLLSVIKAFHLVQCISYLLEP